MKSNNEIDVTAREGEASQESAVVGGSGVRTGSNVAGPLRSLSANRDGTGVASQAPATPKSTRAEKSETELPEITVNAEKHSGAKTLIRLEPQA